MTATTTPRIPLLDRHQVPPDVQGLFDALLAQRGAVTNMQRTIAHTPELLMAMSGFLKVLMGDGALTAVYKELVAVRIAILRGCDYCTASHSAQAKMRGATQAQVDGLWNPDGGAFTPKERLGLRVADEIHNLAHGLPEALYDEVQRVFTTQEIIELMVTASVFEFTTRMVESLGIPVSMLAGSQLGPSR